MADDPFLLSEQAVEYITRFSGNRWDTKLLFATGDVNLAKFTGQLILSEQQSRAQDKEKNRLGQNYNVRWNIAIYCFSQGEYAEQLSFTADAAGNIFALIRGKDTGIALKMGPQNPDTEILSPHQRDSNKEHVEALVRTCSEALTGITQEIQINSWIGALMYAKITGRNHPGRSF